MENRINAFDMTFRVLHFVKEENRALPLKTAINDLCAEKPFLIRSTRA